MCDDEFLYCDSAMAFVCLFDCFSSNTSSSRCLKLILLAHVSSFSLATCLLGLILILLNSSLTSLHFALLPHLLTSSPVLTSTFPLDQSLLFITTVLPCRPLPPPPPLFIIFTYVLG